MTDVMGWGLIGSRGYAANACAPALSAATGARLVSVLGSDRARAQSLADEHGPGTGAGADTLEDFLSTPGLDAVWIASPTYLHHAQALACFRAGKHVLLEKPLASNADEAWGLVEAARLANRLLATGYQARYVPGHHAMQRLVVDGTIGEVLLARTFYGVHRGGPPQEWRQRRDTAHWGALGDTGTHHIDLLRMLLGEVLSACGLVGTQIGYETEDTAVAALRFESGALASLTVSMNVVEEGTLVEVLGTEGTLVATNTSPRGDGSVVLRRPHHDPQDVSGEKVVSFVAQVETVTRAAQGEEVAYATGADGARNIDILEQILP